MQRIFAHRIIHGDETYDCHVAELDAGGRLRFFPFESEIHSTVFVSGTIRLSIDNGIMTYEPVDLSSQEFRSMKEVAER